MLTVVLLSKRYRRYSFKDMVFFFYLALFTIFIPNISQNIGMIYTSASIASIVQSTSPVFAVILAFVFLKETKTINKIVGSFIALIGTILLSTRGISTFDLNTFGNLFVLISSISYAISGVMLKKGLSRFSAFDLLCFETTFGFFTLLLTNVIFEDMSIILKFDEKIWLYILILSVSASFFAALFYYIVLYEEELSYLVIFTYLIPIFAIVFSYLILGETLTLTEVFFAFMILIGIMIAQSRSKTFGKLP